MFKRKVEPDPALEEAIAEVLDRMKILDPESKEYSNCVKQLEKLHALLPEEETVDANTLLTVLGNLTGIAIIVWHEKAHVIASRAFDRVKMLR